jgi:hypothetical protein
MVDNSLTISVEYLIELISQAWKHGEL